MNATPYCMDCPLQDEGCVYSAKKYYFDHLDNGNHDWPISVLLNEYTPEALEHKLRTSSYGKCVYASDNDVVDHQVVAKNVYEQGIMNRLVARAILFPDSIKTRSFKIPHNPDLKKIPFNGPNYAIAFPEKVNSINYAFVSAWEKDGEIEKVEDWTTYLDRLSKELKSPPLVTVIK